MIVWTNCQQMPNIFIQLRTSFNYNNIYQCLWQAAKSEKRVDFIPRGIKKKTSTYNNLFSFVNVGFTVIFWVFFLVELHICGNKEFFRCEW